MYQYLEAFIFYLISGHRLYLMYTATPIQTEAFEMPIDSLKKILLLFSNSSKHFVAICF